MGIIVYFFAHGEWYWICDISQPESPYAGDSLPGKCNAYATPRDLTGYGKLVWSIYRQQRPHRDVTRIIWNWGDYPEMALIQVSY